MTSGPDCDQRDARDRLKAIFLRSAADLGMTQAETCAVLVELIRETAGLAEPDHLPASAPELWQDRDLARGENAAQFTRRVWGPWIGKGLTRKVLSRRDKPLYKALSVWEHRHPQDRITELPTKSEVIDSSLAALAEGLDEFRRLGNSISAVNRRKHSWPRKRI